MPLLRETAWRNLFPDDFIVIRLSAGLHSEDVDTLRHRADVQCDFITAGFLPHHRLTSGRGERKTLQVMTSKTDVESVGGRARPHFWLRLLGGTHVRGH